ncbi:S9 family peptidase [Aureicoccus marinus]|uniref:S9 family peptidase n=1 Tax=Aureicoccus marinus TaxID=754435 RepID=A0A2S7TAU2_9FLAO|nr:S9 family peptidase [Aureicoccus marinus]PQJ16586.1 S9 family peptidase [Aureicoccus marinus]
MKTNFFGLVIALVFSLSLTAQQKAITLEEIWGGAFRTEGINSLRSMNNGRQYTVLNFENGQSQIDKYEYKGLAKVGTILSSSQEGVPRFSSYTFSANESQILLGSEFERIFRWSTIGRYFVYDVESKKTISVADDKIMAPALSPDGKHVAYVKDNNIYVFEIASQSTRQLTTDGQKGSIINGVTDWVYEEEFGFVRAYQWNSDGTRIAFIRFDESEVPQFSMDVYGTNLYPYQYEFKYPKAGETNATVSLHLLEVASGDTKEVDLGDAYYIPRIKWRNHADKLSVQTLNRHQNHLKLHNVDATTATASVLLEEKDEAYVDITDDLTFLEDDSFIWTSERDGWNHIYHYDVNGKLKNQVTKGPWEVTSYYGYDAYNKRIFYQSTEMGSINRDVYSIRSNGKRKNRLTTKTGTNSAQFSKKFLYFVNTFSSADTPYEFSLHLARDGMFMQKMKDNKALMTKLEGYEISPKEYSTISVNGNDLNMYMIKPKDFDPNKKYPLFMFQYSGPGSQQVANRWLGANDYWHQMLASEGYIIACVDGRGTGLKGRDFKKVTYMNLVKYETEDQIAAAKELSKLPYIDENRTGIWGWSYGGHMSTNCLLKGNDTFEMAIAVAPVTSWRFYDTIYTERFMRTPQENPDGYDNESPFNYPELLKGKYLLVHGSGDDNVHVQNSMRMIEALVQANKSFDWAIYPDRNHGIYGGNTRLHLYTKMTQFVKDNL